MNGKQYFNCRYVAAGGGFRETGAEGPLAEGVVGSLGPFGPYAVLFGLFSDYYFGYQYHSHCCPGCAYGDHNPENSASLVMPSCFDRGCRFGRFFQLQFPISHPANVLVMGSDKLPFYRLSESRCFTDTKRAAGVDSDYVYSMTVSVLNLSDKKGQIL